MTEWSQFLEIRQIVTTQKLNENKTEAWTIIWAIPHSSWFMIMLGPLQKGFITSRELWGSFSCDSNSPDSWQFGEEDIKTTHEAEVT